MKKIVLKNIFSLIVVILTVIFIIILNDLNVLPSKYFTIIIIGEIILTLLGILLYNLKNIVLIVLGVLFLLVNVGLNCVGIYYLHNTNSVIDKGFKTSYYTQTTKYYVITTANNTVMSKNELTKDTTIDYYKYSRSIDKALKKLGDYNYRAIDNASDSLYNVLHTNGYFLIASANYDYLFNSTNLLKKEDFKIIDEFDVKEKIERNDTVKDIYNVYIAGLDFTGIMRDYNLIATINTKTHKVVLTSIPRDYYIDVPAYNMKDTLMCLGSLDSEVSKEALENLFDINIDYTINLNTNSLVDVVDKLGGLEFCSDYEFTTTHALVQGTYDDSTGKKLHVSKGCKTYSGIEILTIARERMALPGRDRYRQKNCRQILINIVKKLATTSTLTNYSEVLSSFDGLYTTDMNKKTVTNLFKSILDGNNYEIIEQSVDGTDAIGIGHLGTQESWIMNPDMNTVNTASAKIKEIMQ